MKVRELTADYVGYYLRIDSEDIDSAELESLQAILESAVSFVKNYTGLTDEEMDLYPELTDAVLIYCQDAYDNRSLYTQNGQNNLSKSLEQKLNLHRVNFL